MPPIPAAYYGKTRRGLFDRGVIRVIRFCRENHLPIPRIVAIPPDQWRVHACAYYRPGEIKICLEDCAQPCTATRTRNWNWPGSTIDREPYGVLCHELGHHADYHAGRKKGEYYSEYCEYVQKKSGEPPISGYCPNPAEWFAEMFRLFVTNYALLAQLRPATVEVLSKLWTPVSSPDWRAELGPDVPERVVRSLINKGAK